MPREPQEKDKTLTTDETRLEVEDNQDVKCRMEMMEDDTGIDTPTIQRLRPKPIDVENITVSPQVKSMKLYILY